MRTDRERAWYRRWYYANIETIREKKAAQMRARRKINTEKWRIQQKRRMVEQRDRIHQMYGDSCSLCGFANRLALTLDHILGNGAEERRLLGERGVYRRAIAEHRPSEYRILCMNCQFVTRAVVSAKPSPGDCSAARSPTPMSEGA